MGFYVCIDGVPDGTLNFLGYYKVRKNDEFEIWSDPRGDDHIVCKDGSRAFHVEDINDAIAIGAKVVVPAPDPD